MSQIILDFGSGNTCQNNKEYIKKMYDELKKVDTDKHEIVVKWQLFKEAGKNILLTHECFDYAYKYGTELGYKVTSSVFDKESLDFLLQYNIPFVKIANNRNLDYLIEYVPRGIPIYISHTIKDIDMRWEREINKYGNVIKMFCMSKYPSMLEDYEKQYKDKENSYFLENLWKYVSDHTINFDLWYRYQPDIVEWHFVLKHDKNNLDGGLFARTPRQLSEVL